MYRRYLISLAAGFGLALVLWASLFVGQLGVPSASTQTIFDMLTAKEARAAEQQGRRILFAGGSNVLYGIQARLFEEAFGVRAVNLGVNAGLGVSYILDRVERLMRPGDVVILALEYQMYAYDGSLDGIHADFVLSRDPEYFWSAPPATQWKYAKAFSMLGLLQRNLARFTFDAGKQSERAKSVNEQGDETRNRPEDQDQARKTRVERVRPHHFGTFPESSAGLDAIRKFVHAARERGVLVLVTFPSVMYFPELTEGAAQDYYANLTAFYQSLDVPMLGKPTDFLYPRDMFFDSGYHLMHGPAQERTRQLIAFLREVGGHRADLSLTEFADPPRDAEGAAVP